VQRIDLLKFTEGVSSWAELETRIIGLSSEWERGDAFEQFCHAFFVLDPVFQFEKVYRHNEIPQSLRQKLGYPGIQDIGIDGLAITIDGKLFAYQCKFRSNRNDTPTLRELSTFLTVSDRANWRITITNANSLPTAINDRTNQSRILADHFDQLDSDFFDRLRLYLEEQRIEPQMKKTPREFQSDAIEKAFSHFSENNTGQLILPCGTGKTLIAMWIAERLGGSRILVMVPSLSLMSQALREWAANTSLRPFRYLCLCSDTTVDLGKDSPVEHLYEMDVPVTTDADVVSEFLKNEPSMSSVLFSTYQSSRVLSEAIKKAGIDFDTAIFDEAHRTTGSDVGVWNLALSDKHVPVKNRIFMTATPRIYAPHISRKAKENDVLLYSMDDHEIYAKPFYEMTFGQAIEKNLITDYKVVIICVTDREVREIIQQGGKVITDDKEWDAKAFAKQVALVKAIEAYKLKKIFTFHQRVPNAKAFTKTDSPYGIREVLKIAGSTPNDKINLFHVNGTMSSGYRNSLMKEFRESEIGIMSNARCLIEGVDVPTVDTVAFIDPKRSIIDIVQATGRALRKAEWKEKGYIFIPVVVDEYANPEDLIKSSDFDTVWEVLQAMMDQDQRLESIVSQLRTMQGAEKEGTDKWDDTMQKYSEKVELFTLTKKIEHKRFVEKLNTKTIELTAKTWDFWYGLTLRYKEEFGNANSPNNYKTDTGYSLGKWQTTQRSLCKKGLLTSDRVNRLEDIGFKWTFSEDKFYKGLIETYAYKKQHGNPNAPQGYKTAEGYPLGIWQSSQRQLYKKGWLSQNRIGMLEVIEFQWQQPKSDAEGFENGFAETFLYYERFFNPNAPEGYKTDDGFPLRKWQQLQRWLYKKGKLNQERIQRLEDIEFKWEVNNGSKSEEAFERGFSATLKYRDQFGDPNALVSYKTSNGYPLGEWQAHQRKAYNKGKLNKEKIQRLEEIGFICKRVSKEDAFAIGYIATLKYKEEFGNPNALVNYITSNGYSLGEWQAHQRIAYDKGKLDKEKINRLEEIGFKWKRLNKDEVAFERGIDETIKYREQFGFPNAPDIYKKSDSFQLGKWQAQQQRAYKNGHLSAEKIQRLEEIGFKWKRLNKDEAAFERGIDETVKYKEQFGNPNAPTHYVSPTGFFLGKWQRHQRIAFRDDKLFSERAKKLEAIEFQWFKLKKK